MFIRVSRIFAFFLQQCFHQAELHKKTSFRYLDLRLSSCCSDRLSLDTSGSRNIKNKNGHALSDSSQQSLQTINSRNYAEYLKVYIGSDISPQKNVRLDL